MKILIVEDELLIQKSLKHLLEKKGHNVTATASGREAIEFILNDEYQRIICDLMLSDITGFDIIEEAKSKYSLDTISNLFVIITAYSSAQVLDKAEGYGCKIIEKPFEDMKNAISIMTKEPNES